MARLHGFPSFVASSGAGPSISDADVPTRYRESNSSDEARSFSVTALTATGGDETILWEWTYTPAVLGYEVHWGLVDGGPYPNVDDVMVADLGDETTPEWDQDRTGENGVEVFGVVVPFVGDPVRVYGPFSNEASATPAAPVGAQGLALYYSESGGAKIMPLDPADLSAQTALYARASAGFRGLAVHYATGDLFAAAQGLNLIVRLAYDGSGSRIAAASFTASDWKTGLASPYGLHVHGDTVFWSETSTGVVNSAAIGSPGTVTAYPALPLGAAQHLHVVDSGGTTYIYCCGGGNTGSDGRCYRRDAADTSSGWTDVSGNLWVATNVWPFGVACDDTYYYVIRVTSATQSAGVWRGLHSDPDPGDLVRIHTSTNQVTPQGGDVYDGDLYVVNVSSGNTVVTLPLPDGTAFAFYHNNATDNQPRDCAWA